MQSDGEPQVGTEVLKHERVRRRFGVHASVIQLFGLLIIGSSLDGGITQDAVTLASVLFWTCSAPLLIWRRDRASGIDLLFLRWGLLAFVLIGTPLLRPMVQWWPWFALLLLPSKAVLLVMASLYLVTRAFGLKSPFDDTGSES